MPSSMYEPMFEDVYVARLPVLNLEGEVWGYDLLFRDGADAVEALIKDEDAATTCVATFGVTRALERQTAEQKIIITFTEKLILEGAPRALPPEITVVRLPATIAASTELVEALRELRDEGYMVSAHAIPDLPMNNVLLSVADIIEVDTLGSDILAAIELAKTHGAPGRKIVAGRVETPELQEYFKMAGCDLFKGYYFSQPERLAGRKISSEKQSRLTMLAKIDDPSLSVEDFSEIIRPDPSLSYRLLRFLNSAAFDFLREINSIAQAISLLGLGKFRHWLRLVIVSDMNSRPAGSELSGMSFSRGILFQKLAEKHPETKLDPDAMFLFGLFSLLGVMLEVQLEHVLSFLPLSKELKNGYFDEQSTHHDYLKLASALEHADWDEVDFLCADMRLDNDDVLASYNHALAAVVVLSPQL